MGKLRDLLQQESGDIVKGYIHQSSISPSEARREEDQDFAIKSGHCAIVKLPLDQLEQMLSAQYGDRLQPKHEYKAKNDFDFRKMTKGKQKERKNTSPLEPAKLQPKHLTAVRLKELAADGKTLDDIVKLYNFTTQKYLKEKLKELGCKDLFKREKGVKGA